MIFGVIMDKGLKWNSHVEYIIKKTCKKLYWLRVFRRAGVCRQANILKIYLNTMRPVREYAVPVWQAIPAYLSYVLERVQKSVLKIICPEAES